MERVSGIRLAQDYFVKIFPPILCFFKHPIKLFADMLEWKIFCCTKIASVIMNVEFKSKGERPFAQVFEKFWLFTNLFQMYLNASKT